MQQFNRRIFFVLIVLLGLTWLFISRYSSVDQAGAIISPGVGFHPPAFTLDTITGESVSLDDYTGMPVILNFWASWCPPCRAEMPALQAVYSQYQDEVIILAINATNQDSISGAKNIQSEFGLEFHLLMDATGAVQRAYKISSLPTTFFISPGGKINEIKIGGPLTETSLRIWIEKMLLEMP